MSTDMPTDSVDRRSIHLDNMWNNTRVLQIVYRVIVSANTRPIDALRLVFTSDGVVVGVVIRSVERYDLVKIKLTESEAEQ